MPRPVPPGGVRINLGVRVTPGGLERLDALATQAGLTRTQAVRAALADWCENQESIARHRKPTKG